MQCRIGSGFWCTVLRDIVLAAVVLSLLVPGVASASSARPGQGSADQNWILLYPTDLGYYHGSFMPSGQIVPTGTTITWSNGTGVPQTLEQIVTARDPTPLFPPQALPVSGSYSYTFSQPGLDRFTLQGLPQTLNTILVEAPTSPPTYRIEDLGPATSPNGIRSIEINNQGQIVDTAKTITLPDGSTGYGLDINNIGSVIGVAGNRDFLLDANGRLTWITGIAVNAINDLDEVVGMADDRAAIWRNGHVTIIDQATIGISEATDLNDVGQVVGSGPNTTTGDPGSYLYRWWYGTATNLGSLGGCGGVSYGINATGQVVGMANVPNDFGKCAADGWAFVWDHGTIFALGLYDQEAVQAYAINRSQQIVGLSESGGFLWQHGQLYDLQSLIQSNTGWGGLNPYDINDAGQIVGWGQIGGRTDYFVMTPL